MVIAVRILHSVTPKYDLCPYLTAELWLHSESIAWAAAGSEGPLQRGADAEVGPGECLSCSSASIILMVIHIE